MHNTIRENIKVWKRDGYRLTLYDIGTDRLAYRFTDHGKVIFEGKDFRPSPMYAIDSLDTAYALLGFLSLQPGDTDSEYFENYTQSQMEWANSYRAEYLGILVSDFEERKTAHA